MVKSEILAEAEDSIKRAIKQNGPFTHNLISLTLGDVADRLGNKYANDLIDTFGLEDLGWHKQPVPDD